MLWDLFFCSCFVVFLLMLLIWFEWVPSGSKPNDRASHTTRRDTTPRSSARLSDAPSDHFQTESNFHSSRTFLTVSLQVATCVTGAHAQQCARAQLTEHTATQRNTAQRNATRRTTPHDNIPQRGHTRALTHTRNRTHTLHVLSFPTTFQAYTNL